MLPCLKLFPLSRNVLASVERIRQEAWLSSAALSSRNKPAYSSDPEVGKCMLWHAQCEWNVLTMTPPTKASMYCSRIGVKNGLIDNNAIKAPRGSDSPCTANNWSWRKKKGKEMGWKKKRESQVFMPLAREQGGCMIAAQLITVLCGLGSQTTHLCDTTRRKHIAHNIPMQSIEIVHSLLQRFSCASAYYCEVWMTATWICT